MSDASSYRSFYDRHCAYLDRHGADLPEKQRKLPLRFLEEEGLECALWPHLYWQRDLCETVARASHAKRQQRKRRRARGPLDSDSSEDREDDEEGNVDTRSGLGRIKRGFLRKVLSPVVACTLSTTSASGRPSAPRRTWLASSTFRSASCSVAGHHSIGASATWPCWICSGSAGTRPCFALERPAHLPLPRLGAARAARRGPAPSPVARARDAAPSSCAAGAGSLFLLRSPWHQWQSRSYLVATRPRRRRPARSEHCA